MPPPSDRSETSRSEIHQLVRQALHDHEHALIGYTAGILHGDVERAREVVQDAFLKLCKADPKKVRSGLKAWLFTVCRNRAFDVLRKEQRLDFGNELVLDHAPDEHRNPGTAVEFSELHQRVWQLVEGLTPNQREVVRLKFQHELSYQQISDITGLTTGNVGFILHTAIRKLRERMQSEIPA